MLRKAIEEILPLLFIRSFLKWEVWWGVGGFYICDIILFSWLICYFFSL